MGLEMCVVCGTFYPNETVTGKHSGQLIRFITAVEEKQTFTGRGKRPIKLFHNSVKSRGDPGYIAAQNVGDK